MNAKQAVRRSSTRSSSRSSSLAARIRAAALALPLLGSCAPAIAQATPPPAFAPGTAIPILFTRSLEAGKSKVGDVVQAQTMQEVELADGRIAPKGTKLLGHVLASARLQHNSGQRSPSDTSTLSFQFDSATVQGSAVPISVALRVLASRVTATDAMTPRYLDVKDHIGTFTLIGGDLYLRTDTDVVTPGSKVVGFKDNQGVFGKLKAGSGSDLRCAASDAPQSLAIFSPEACGLYGFEGVSVTPASEPGGAIMLHSDSGNVNVYAYSAAFLQVVAPTR